MIEFIVIVFVFLLGLAIGSAVTIEVYAKQLRSFKSKLEQIKSDIKSVKQKKGKQIMYPTTRKIIDKGYNLKEFCKKIGYSLGWYRTHCKQADTRQNEMIQDFINELESK
jgi:hypothetical protein